MGFGVFCFSSLALKISVFEALGFKLQGFRTCRTCSVEGLKSAA